MDDGFATAEIRVEIAPLVDAAIANAKTAEERYWWDAGYTMLPNAAGGFSPTGMLALTCASPILGAPSIVSTAFMDLRQLLDESNATDAVRHLIENLRTACTQSLANGNGQA